MRFRPRARRQRERWGAAAVELAVTSPLLVLLFVGMAEFGSIFFSRHTMILAAREGARQLAVEGATEQEAIDVVEDYLDTFGIGNATITAQNAYKGNGDDAAARRVNILVEVSPAEASILGDMLNVFAPSSVIRADVSMRKEGELLTEPTS